MNGFERLKEQVKDQEDAALQETVRYLLNRDDLEKAFLSEDKSLEEMCNFIRDKGRKHSKNGWNFIINDVVYTWAVMYYSLPNEYLGIKSQKRADKSIKSESNNKKKPKDNVLSIEKARKEMKKKKEVKQLSLFGGVA